jgi:hypothetical protein
MAPTAMSVSAWIVLAFDVQAEQRGRRAAWCRGLLREPGLCRR